MRYWDASAIVPIVINEPSSAAVVAMLDQDPHIVAWWTTELECVSAISRREREGRLDAADVASATARLRMLRTAWDEVEPGARLRQTATRLLRVHPLRAADALQLAAAITAADDDPRSLPFVDPGPAARPSG